MPGNSMNSIESYDLNAMEKMRYKQTVVPTLWPVTLDEAKQHCSILDETWDDYFDGLIKKATAAVEKRLSRQILPATWTLSMDCFPSEIVIEKLPVTAITSIVYKDANGTTTMLSTSDYQKDLSSYDSPARIKPVDGKVWPSTQSDTYNAVVVTFTAGYSSVANVPQGIKNAVLFLIAHWFRVREPVNIGNIVNDISATLDMALSSEDWGIYT